ncbi:fliE: flagellar hook-basal body complex protein FliE [Solimicrobium silvestre]|uniref:Flagellar hook-basal body complex protein FliE n=2 Tax=Solimicrobium silvestre TaxID=2099400 RepID=A0A2S9H1Q8_9BURK|nr:fliE: flagellar hook-basal body complex protein FliE [Solimicrobium silvestre]
MTIDAISFLPATSLPSLLPAGESNSTLTTGGAFGAWFEQHLSEINSKMAIADTGVQQLAAGDATNLHEVMINLQEARMSLQLMMQVRNHLLDAYHDVAQMQL